MIGGNDHLDKVEGTTYFLSPECCKSEEDDSPKGFAGKPVDIWALGVTAFVLTFKKLPFFDESNDMMEIYNIINKGE